MSLPVVAIVGRPNVGKSTLFNRLIGRKKAVIDDRPGVTRDRNYEQAELFDRHYMLIDTGGIEPRPGTRLLAAMARQVDVAVEEADVIIFVVDGRTGLNVADSEVAGMLRRANKPTLLVVNKIDGPRHDVLEADFWGLGFATMYGLSAAHGRGVYELMDALQESLPEQDGPVTDMATDPADDGEDGPPSPLRIAVIGRPNIGKSTLINQLVGADRHVVADEPGTTMDPVDSPLTIDGQDYVLVDTAGVRRRQKIDTQLERFISLRSIQAIERCHVALLIIDGVQGPTDQDSRLAQLVESRGRGLVILINKWDLTKDEELINSRSIEDKMDRQLIHVSWAPHLFISAKTGKGVHRILPMVQKAYAEFNRRVTTSKLNQFLLDTIDAHTPPQRYHRPVRLYYVTQHRVRPPTFTFFSNTPDGVVPAYRKYLSNQLRKNFGFEGTPLRLQFKARRKLGANEDD